MDDTRRGVLISFLAPILVLPLMLWLGPAPQTQSASETVTTLDVFRALFGSAIGILGFPLAMFYVSKYLGRGARYSLLVVTVNWTSPWQALLMAAGYAFYYYADLPAALNSLPLFLAATFNMIYIWFAIRVSLAVSGAMAAGMIVLLAAIQWVGYLMTQITIL